MQSASLTQSALDELQRAGASQEVLNVVGALKHDLLVTAGVDDPDDHVRTRGDIQRETLASLSLYIGHHTWTQLTTEQKECLADAVDTEFRQNDDGIDPVDRWWRD